MPLNDAQRQRVIEKVEKLMRFTKENGASLGEIENAAAKVGQLLRENNLDLEDITVEGLKSDVGSEFSTLEMGRIQDWQYQIFDVIPKTCSCTVMYVSVWAPTPKQPKRKAKKIKLFGTFGDLKMCRYFCDVLCIVLPAFAKQYCDSLEYDSRAERATATTSYIKGMLNTINQRLAKMVRPPDEAPESASRGLIIINNKAVAVNQKMKEEHPHSHDFITKGSAMDPEHYENGQEKGKEVDLNFGLAHKPIPNLA